MADKSDNMVDEHINEMSPPDTDAQSGPDGQPPDGEEPTDKFGNLFDENLHQTYKDSGEPRVSSKGNLFLQHGAKQQAKIRAGKASGTETESVEDIPPERLNAVVNVETKMWKQIHCLMGKYEKWDWQTEAEKEEFADALRDMHRAYGLPEMPPWAGFALAAGGYYARRVNVQDDILGDGSWFERKLKQLQLWGMIQWNKITGRTERVRQMQHLYKRMFTDGDADGSDEPD